MQPVQSPWEYAERDEVDMEALLEKLQPKALPRTKSTIDRTFSGLQRTISLQRASSGVTEGVKTALERTSSIKSAISRSSSAGAKEVLAALQHTASGDFREATEQGGHPRFKAVQVQNAWERFERGSLAHAIARVLICIFFLDCGLERYQNWQFYRTDFMRKRIENYPHRYQDPGFPYFDLFVVVPCSLLTMVGISTWLTAGLLVVDMLRDSIGIIITGMVRVFQHRLEPDELTAKHLAMLGSATLVLVHSMRERYTCSNTVAEYAAGAGLLIGEPDRAPGHVKSLFLLFGRIALTVLFLTVGISQAKRIIRRDWAMYARHEMLRSDGHDNHFLLVEALLAVPFAIGFRTRLVAPVLALTLLLEAIFCWWPLDSWPSVQYQSHVRSHFATNLGAAGGLLLLQTYGAGRYTLDRLLKKQS